MIRYFKLICVCISYFTPILCGAQYNNTAQERYRNSVLAHEHQSYFTFSSGFGNLDPLIFESKLCRTFFFQLKENAKLAFSGTPMVVLRMYNEYSVPVRTPSYMPEGSVYYNLGKTNFLLKDQLTLFSKFGHHSNGQSDSTYNVDGTVNIKSGNFSTNFIEIGFMSSEIKPGLKNIVKGYRSSLAFHFFYEPLLEDNYGTVYWNNEFQISMFRPLDIIKAFRKGYKNSDSDEADMRSRLKIKTSYALVGLDNKAAFDFKERFTFTATYSYQPRFYDQLAVFVKFYWGKDYYNINYRNNIHYVTFGLISTPLSIEKFERKRKRAAILKARESY